MEPDAPTVDLVPWCPVVRDAAVVGIGEATRFTHELFTVKFRLVRFLVEQLGFRALADDWTKGLQLDAYVHTAR